MRASVVLPQPDSPTMPRVSPGAREKLTPSTPTACAERVGDRLRRDAADRRRARRISAGRELREGRRRPCQIFSPAMNSVVLVRTSSLAAAGLARLKSRMKPRRSRPESTLPSGGGPRRTANRRVSTRPRASSGRMGAHFPRPRVSRTRRPCGAKCGFKFLARQRARVRGVAQEFDAIVQPGDLRIVG